MGQSRASKMQNERGALMCVFVSIVTLSGGNQLHKGLKHFARGRFCPLLCLVTALQLVHWPRTTLGFKYLGGIPPKPGSLTHVPLTI